MSTIHKYFNKRNPAGEFPFYEELGEKRTNYGWDKGKLATPLTVDHYVHMSPVTGESAESGALESSGADGQLGDRFT